MLLFDRTDLCVIELDVCVFVFRVKVCIYLSVFKDSQKTNPVLAQFAYISVVYFVVFVLVFSITVGMRQRNLLHVVPYVLCVWVGFFFSI